MKKKNLFLAFLIVVLSVTFGQGCTKKKDDKTPLYALLFSVVSTEALKTSACDKSVTPELTFKGNITTSTTWPKSTKIDGVVSVKSGATLTIPAGAYVYGGSGSVIMVEAGAKIVAEGTVAAPICMTSAQAVGSRKAGDWGGLVIVGNGIGSRTSTTEGSAAGIALAYGAGTDDADSSGSLKYVVVDFAGYYFTANEELNSFSLYTVGSGTTIEHIQANMGLDDGVEIWGGKVNIKWLLVTAGADDDLDLDEGYTGKVQYMIGQKFPASCGLQIASDPRGFEQDGTPSGAVVTGASPAKRTTNTRISNFTLLGQKAGNDTGIFAREGINATYTHGLIYGFTTDRTSSEKTGLEPTKVYYKDMLTQSGNNADDTSIETGNSVANINTSTSVSDALTSSPVVAADGAGCNPKYPDFTPTGLAAVAAPESVATAQGNDTFFTSNTTYGAVVGGDQWYLGWTVNHTK